MEEKFRESSRVAVTAGFLTGLAIAAVISGLAWLNQDRSELLRAAVNFLSSLPLFVGFNLKAPQAAARIFFFFYWGAVGASFGWLSNQRRFLRHEVAALFAVALAALHWAAEARLSAGIDSALRALAEALKQPF